MLIACTVYVLQVVAGQNHSFALTTAAGLYAWGHGAEGRLGIGTSWRAGVADTHKHFFPAPVPLQSLSSEVVRQVACGPTFALAVSDTNCWSWGSGDGGCLGQGDVKKRERPCVIEALQGMHVMQVIDHIHLKCMCRE